jgi:hypothetical protein
MPARVQISGGTGWYTFPINPIEFDNPDGLDVSINQTIDGYSYEIVPAFDGRVRTMTWNRLPNKEPMITMINNLKALQSTSTYLKLRDLTGELNQTTEQSIRVIDVTTSFGIGGPSDNCYMKYETVKLRYVCT